MHKQHRMTHTTCFYILHLGGDISLNPRYYRGEMWQIKTPGRCVCVRRRGGGGGGGGVTDIFILYIGSDHSFGFNI